MTAQLLEALRDLPNGELSLRSGCDEVVIRSWTNGDCVDTTIV